MLVHRVTGVVNFAHGAMAMLAAYAFVALRPAVGTVGALAGAVAVSAGLGLLVHVGVFARLAGRPPLTGVVASVGVLTTLQALATLAFGTETRFVPALLPSGPVGVAGTTVPADRLLLCLAVALVTGALWAVSRFTRVGLAGRAAAEDTAALALLGWSPGRLAAGTWILAGVLGGLGAVASGPITALDPVSSTLLIVPALGAAAVGGLSSFALTSLGGLGIGVAQSLVLVAQDRLPWVPRSGVREALPLVVIVVALGLGAGRRLGRGPGGSLVQGQGGGQGAASRLPAAPAPPAHLGRYALVSSLVGALVLAVAGDQGRLAATTSMIGTVLCLSLVILTGYGGQISLAQMAFAGLAGFTLTALGDGLGVPFPVAPLLGALVAAGAGLLVGLPALRVRGTSLAVVTLASAVALEDLVFKNPVLTGGFGGREVPDLGLGPASSLPFGLFVLAVTVAVAVAVARLRDGRLGRRFLAVRADETAARAVGVDAVATRLTAFGLSAFVAGLGGGLLAYSQARLSFGSFGVFVSLSLLAVAYLGGITRVSGAVVGGLLVNGGLIFGTLDRAAGLGRYRLLVTGLALVAIAVLRPEGLVVGRRRVARRRRVAGRLRGRTPRVASGAAPEPRP